MYQGLWFFNLSVHACGRKDFVSMLKFYRVSYLMEFASISWDREVSWKLDLQFEWCQLHSLKSWVSFSATHPLPRGPGCRLARPRPPGGALLPLSPPSCARLCRSAEPSCATLLCPDVRAHLCPDVPVLLGPPAHFHVRSQNAVLFFNLHCDLYFMLPAIKILHALKNTPSLV